MGFRLSRVGPPAFIAAGVLAACQAVSGLGDLNKVDCAPCEAGPDPDAAPPCTHTFCASFDQSPVNAGWKAVQQSSGAKVELDNVESKSPPASFLSSVPKNDLGGVEATLSQTFAKPLKGFNLELDVRVAPGAFPDAGAPIVDAGPVDGDAEAAVDAGTVEDASAEAGVDAGPVGPFQGGLVKLVAMSAAESGDVSVAFAWTASGPVVIVASPSDAGTETVLPLTKTPPPNTWAHVKIDVAFDANGKGSVKVQIDGAPALDRNNLSMIGAGAPSSQLTLGLSTRNVTPEFKVNFDNLTLDVDP